MFEWPGRALAVRRFPRVHVEIRIGDSAVLVECRVEDRTPLRPYGRRSSSLADFSLLRAFCGVFS